MSRMLLVLWCGLVLGGLSSSVEAQERSVAKLTAQQARSLDEAVRLTRDKDLKGALEIYNGLLDEVRMDLLYLNRGRVLQRMGRCAEASEAFAQVLEAPRVPNIDAATILKTLRGFQKELEGTCEGSVRVLCSQEGTTVRVEDRKTAYACGDLISLPPGSWEIRGHLHEETFSRRVEVRGTRVTEATLSMGRDNFLGAGRLLLSSNPGAAYRYLEEALRKKADQEVYLYLAEALLGLGEDRCQDAYVALDTVAATPASKALSPLEVASRQNNLRARLGEFCGEPVRIQCLPADMSIRVDGGTPSICSPAPIFLKKGEHTLLGTTARREGAPSQSMTRRITVEEGRSHEVDMTLVPEKKLGALGWGGLASAGVGASLLLGAVVVDRTSLEGAIATLEEEKERGASRQALQNSLGEVEDLQQMNRGLIVSGSVLFLVGTSMALADWYWFQERERSPLQVQVGREEVKVQWTFAMP